MTRLDISSVAVIGAGPGGLAALYELTHTNQDGTSTVGGAKASDPKFTKIVAFEQQPRAGGIWADTGIDADPPVPRQTFLDSGNYNDPDVIHPARKIPTDLSQTSLDKPYVQDVAEHDLDLDWRRNGVFPELFSNVPARFMRFSYIPFEQEFLDKSRVIYPFLTLTELRKTLYDFYDREGLDEYIRTNSKVENVGKNDRGKWVITVRHIDPDYGKENWYQEEFDAVIISVGHYRVPYLPRMKGLAEFNKAHPGVFIHAKAYRNREIFVDKKVLVVGSGQSSTNLLQYIVPVAKGTYLAKRGPNNIFPWIDRAVETNGIIVKPGIEAFLPETNEVLFTDGAKEGQFDIVLFATGYHFHYPFLKDHFKIIGPSHFSRVSGLYYNTFNIEDPTLAAVGLTVSPLTFHSIESSAAAIACVWSNAKTLPPKSEQIKWEQDRLASTANNLLFHYFKADQAKEGFMDKVYELSANDRHHPFEEDSKYLHEIDDGLKTIEDLFYKLKDGELTIEDTCRYPLTKR